MLGSSRGRLATPLREHGRREVDRGDAVTARGKLEREEAGAAADIERVERASCREHEIEDAIPGGALGGRADAVAEVLVELRRSPLPVGGDLLLDLVVWFGAHAISLALARA